MKFIGFPSSNDSYSKSVRFKYQRNAIVSLSKILQFSIYTNCIWVVTSHESHPKLTQLFHVFLPCRFHRCNYIDWSKHILCYTHNNDWWGRRWHGDGKSTINELNCKQKWAHNAVAKQCLFIAIVVTVVFIIRLSYNRNGVLSHGS